MIVSTPRHRVPTKKTMTKCTRRMSHTQMSRMHLEMHDEGFGVGKLTG
jgi:hypothetical protein